MSAVRICIREWNGATLYKRNGLACFYPCDKFCLGVGIPTVRIDLAQGTGKIFLRDDCDDKL